MKLPRKSFGALVVAVLALSACGGSDDSGESGTNNTSGEAATADESADADGAGSNDEAQESLDEAGVDLDLDELEETVTGFSTGEGGGVVTIDGVAYEYVAEICISQGTDFVASGPSQSPDGTPAWVEVESSVVLDLDGDGTEDASASVNVNVGQTEMFGGGPDDQPRFSASSTIYEEAFSYTLENGRMAGSGELQDHNFVVLEFDEVLPFTFDASCG